MLQGSYKMFFFKFKKWTQNGYFFYFNLFIFTLSFVCGRAENYISSSKRSSFNLLLTVAVFTNVLSLSLPIFSVFLDECFYLLSLLINSSIYTLVYHNLFKIGCLNLNTICDMNLKSQSILRLLLTLMEIHTWMHAKHF